MQLVHVYGFGLRPAFPPFLVKPVTIRNAVYAIQGKLSLDSKQEMVVWAVRNGLLDD